MKILGVNRGGNCRGGRIYFRVTIFYVMFGCYWAEQKFGLFFFIPLVSRFFLAVFPFFDWFFFCIGLILDKMVE